MEETSIRNNTYIKLGALPHERVRDGDEWDDGIHPEIKMIILTYGDEYLSTIQVGYCDEDGQTKLSTKKGESFTDSHVKVIRTTSPITRIVGCYGYTQTFKRVQVVRSLNFTSADSAGTFVCSHDGDYSCTTFSFEDENGIAGFHGNTYCGSISAIGVYVKLNAS